MNVLWMIWAAFMSVDYCEGKSTLNGKLESDYATNNKLFHPSIKGKELDESFPLEKSKYCRAPAACQPLNYTTCYGVRLPYSSTSLTFIPDVSSQEEAQEKLQKWKRLVVIPKCWAVIQAYLCALYVPKCEDGYVNLPSMEMCEIIQGPCRILKTGDMWPSEFICGSSLPSGCKNEVRELKFNTSGKCEAPFVQAEQEESFYEGVEGCGLQCHDPLFTSEQRQEIRSIVIFGSFLAFALNLFTVMTFLIDWKSANKYPSQAIFYINFCFLMVSVGYLYQFRPGAGDYTVCHKDGTLRTSEPSIRENLSCVTSFVFAYYFFIAGIVWFVIFAYAWKLSSQAVGKIKERMDKKGPYYHLIAWSLPLVLTITIMALGEVDGDSLLGICFVGVVNKQMKIIFLLIPLLGGLVGLYFFATGLVTLVNLTRTSRDVISKHAKAKIRQNILRVSLFSFFSLLFGITTFVCNVYDFLHYQEWKDNFRKHFVCKIVADSEVNSCKMSSGPSVLMVQLQLLGLYGMHINMSTWVWTHSTVQLWTKFIMSKLMNKEIEEPVVLKKHKVIAKAFAKRKLMNSDGRLSISVRNSHQGPVDLNIELNSLTSNNLSTTWAKALPKLITRRDAIIPGSNSSYRRNSADSEISYSIRRVSVESRRHSLDSTVSVQAVEVTKTIRKRPRDKRHKKRHNNFEHRSKHRRSSSNPHYKNGSHSSLETEVLTAYNINIQQSSGIPNMSRRSAISGIEMESLKKLLDGFDAADLSINNSEVTKNGSEAPEDSDMDSESDDSAPSSGEETTNQV